MFTFQRPHVNWWKRLVLVQFDKEASQPCDIASQRTRRFARLAQILRGAKSACSRMTQTAPPPKGWLEK
jgi:hypothetical protein